MRSFEWSGMKLPRRIQRKRTKGWLMPPNTVSVCRPGPWGNPFVVIQKFRPGRRVGLDYFSVPTAEDAVECFRLCACQREGFIDAVKRELCGKNLACWCKLTEPCHADVLLEIANNEPEGSRQPMERETQETLL